MSSRPPSHHLLPALLALGLAVAGLAGCSRDDEPAPAPAPTSSPATTAPVDDVVGALTRALDARARAVRAHDDAAFVRTLGRDPAFRAQQRTWFGNLAQLPLARFRYRLDPASLMRDDRGYWVTVTEVMQLDGYDATPVTSPHRFHLAVHAHARPRLTSVTDAAWAQAHDVRPQPWELGPIEVRTGAGVLGIFDADTVDDAGPLIGSVERGIADVSTYVPYEWSRSVVFYALSDPTFLDGLEGLPGDDPGDLDAVSFPAGESTRFVLNPRVIGRPGPARDRLVRHELTHVAVGARADDVPTWLSEGLAEWVSVRPMPPARRRLPDAALAAARAGTPDLPDDASFADDDSQAHYGLAWWAVEYVARTYGDQAPWLLLDALGEPGADPERVLREEFGTSTRALARRADRLILATYAARPASASASPSPTTSPTPSPTSGPSGGPTDSATPGPATSPLAPASGRR